MCFCSNWGGGSGGGQEGKGEGDGRRVTSKLIVKSPVPLPALGSRWQVSAASFFFSFFFFFFARRLTRSLTSTD